MRYFCWTCHKSVTSELPDDSVIRALLICPECIEADKVTFLDDDPSITAVTQLVTGKLVPGMTIEDRWRALNLMNPERYPSLQDFIEKWTKQ